MTHHRVLQVLTAAVSLIAVPLRAQCAAGTQTLINSRHFDDVRAALEAQLRRAPTDDAAMHCMGRLLLEQDRSGDAVEWLDKATQLNGKSAQHHLWLGVALRTEGQKAGMLRGPGLIGRMKTELEQALALDPALVDARYTLLQYYAAAPSAFGGSVVEARAQAAAILKLSAMRGHIGYAFVSDQEKDFAAAEKEYLAAIAVSPDSDVAYGAAGAFYRRRERWTDAVAMYQNQLARMKKDAPLTKLSNAHYFLGLAEEKSGRRDKAAAEYHAALAANSANEDAQKALASLNAN